MPRLVADSIPWHTSADTVCVGQSEYPGRFEWELRSGAFARLLTRARLCVIPLSPKETSEGNRTGPGAPCFLRSKGENAQPARVLERGHNLGTTAHFGASAPGPSPPQNWSPDSIRGSRLHFEWIASGLTAVCFWNAPGREIPVLEGPVWFGLAPDCSLARSSPNRCLAGLHVRAA